MNVSYIERLRSVASEIASDGSLSALQRQLALEGVEDALDALEGVSGRLDDPEPRPLVALGDEQDGAGVVFGARLRRKRGARSSAPKRGNRADG